MTKIAFIGAGSLGNSIDNQFIRVGGKLDATAP